MTPQEHQLVDELFDRLAELETTPRDADAERLVADGTKRAPHALYALLQTALLQDEALKRANARIEELQAQLDEDEQPQQPQQKSFLESMRSAAFGRGDARGSVPSVRPPDTQSRTGEQPDHRWEGYAGQRPPFGSPPPEAPYPGGPYPGGQYPGGPSFGSGGSFLGSAASTAAGVIGGGLLLNSIRSMFGQHSGLGGHQQNPFGNLGAHASPSGDNAAGSTLARDLGIDHIGHGGGADAGNHQAQGVAGLSHTADNEKVDDNNVADNDDDFDGDDEGDSDGDDGDTYDT